MKIESLHNKKILILGYGLEGKATHEFLKKFAPDSLVGIADQKDGPDYLLKQNEYDLVIKTAGIPRRLVTRPYTTATNIFFANCGRPVIGITGTKGKSTTTSLIYAILKEAGMDAYLVGNIGRPSLNELMSPKGENAVYVCELSSYQLEDIEYSPHISLILNLFPEHMDYHGSLENYYAAKKRIVAYATSRDYLVYNPAYPELAELAHKTKTKSIPFGDILPFPAEAIPLRGGHNVKNVLAALEVARIMKISDQVVESAVRKFKSLPHRLEFVGRFKDIDFYDDAISTTPESTIQAINSIPNIGTIFLGGQDRGYDFRALAETIVAKNISNMVFFPDSGERIKKALENLKFKISNLKFLDTKDMKEAVKFAYEHTPPGMACVLSCASPSYSVWKNFEEKGDLFKQWVREAGKEKRD